MVGIWWLLRLLFAVCRDRPLIVFCLISSVSCFPSSQDLSEAIQEGSLDLVDNSDFVQTDIPPPHKMGLPTAQYLDEDEREDVRDWVLTMSVDADIDQTLPTRDCDNCGTHIYEASLSCHSCRTQYPSCIVSGACCSSDVVCWLVLAALARWLAGYVCGLLGKAVVDACLLLVCPVSHGSCGVGVSCHTHTGYPIPASQLVSCTACGSRALKAAWNTLLVKTGKCPWCGAGQSPVY